MRIQRWTIYAVLGLALLCIGSPSAVAQQDMDAAKVDAQHHKVIFENDQVRIVRWQIPPGESTTMHSHPAHVNVFLTDINVQVTSPDGKTTTGQGKAGDASWRTPVTHVVKNLSDKPAEGVLVEPKTAHSAEMIKRNGAATVATNK